MLGTYQSNLRINLGLYRRAVRLLQSEFIRHGQSNRVGAGLSELMSDELTVGILLDPVLVIEVPAVLLTHLCGLRLLFLRGEGVDVDGVDVEGVSDVGLGGDLGLLSAGGIALARSAATFRAMAPASL